MKLSAHKTKQTSGTKYFLTIKEDSLIIDFLKEKDAETVFNLVRTKSPSGYIRRTLHEKKVKDGKGVYGRVVFFKSPNIGLVVSYERFYIKENLHLYFSFTKFSSNPPEAFNFILNILKPADKVKMLMFLEEIV